MLEVEGELGGLVCGGCWGFWAGGCRPVGGRRFGLVEFWGYEGVRVHGFVFPVDVFCCFGWDGVAYPFGCLVQVMAADQPQNGVEVVSDERVDAGLLFGGCVLEFAVQSDGTEPGPVKSSV